ncbi:MFS transporter [Fulvivirga sp. M361]|uniref:MFS transporter n=1 Tax=Fulvivirga sp. M361 TaxID=2594266 RepID=UPI001179ECB7|nr:MFS transporter [Fulvivirga sp. M361]TRX48793.1 MFS transporter [Fulvivirga sp. M361]
MENDKTRIPFAEKISYGLGDFASSMFWKLFSMFLLFFYTDVFGISAAAVGTMFLITRIWDAANDPLMGILADRTHSKWGKFRPYLLFIAVPFAIVGVLTFSTPDLSPYGKLIYAYVTYSLMMMVYTAVNVPYSSLMGVMTNDPGERTALASFRFIGAFSGGLLVTATANSLINYFGKEDQAAGFQYTIGIYAIIAAILFVLTFTGTRERLRPVVTSQRSSLKDDLKDISKNGPWFIMLGAGIAILIFNSLRDGSILYYFKYYVQDQTLSFLGKEYTLTHTVLSSAYMSLWLATNIVGVVLAKPVSSRLGKKRTFALSAVFSALFSFMLFFFKPDQIGWIFFSNILIGISAGIILPLAWSMYADIADYSEWKTGRRATGLIFSSSSMSQKFGWTLGGAITGWLLAGFGFEANIEQSEETLLGIRLMISVIAGLGALLSFGFIHFYKLDEEFMEKVVKDLEKSRENQ